MTILEFSTKDKALQYLAKEHMQHRPYDLSQSACSGSWILEFQNDKELNSGLESIFSHHRANEND